MDTNIPDDQKGQQLMAALGTVADPSLRAKLTAATNYASAVAKREAYRTNIEDRGYHLDEYGNLVKGKKTAPSPVDLSRASGGPAGASSGSAREKIEY
jgi:hypothetical protein